MVSIQFSLIVVDLFADFLSFAVDTRERWARCYAEIYRDGYFKYYDNDYSPNAEDVIYMPTECVAIKIGYQVNLISQLLVR